MLSMRCARFLCVFLGISTVLCPRPPSIQPDTAQLAVHLKRFRHYKLYELQPHEYRSIQDEYLAWLDTRMTKGTSLAVMNNELQAANLLSKESEDPDDFFDKNYVGFLGGIGETALAGVDDLLAVSLGIHTGGYCNFDETVVLYDRNTRHRIAKINGELTYTHGYWLRSLASENYSAAHQRLAASAWEASNCTSFWNGTLLRIDTVSDPSATNILDTGVSAFGAAPIKTAVDGDSSRFEYTTRIGDTLSTYRTSTRSYLVQDGHAIRQSPIAVSIGGFIDEWLSMNDSEAAQWAAPEAATLHRQLVAKFSKKLFQWRQVAECPGSPPTREVAIRPDQSGQISVFRLDVSSARGMRVVAVSNHLSAPCREIRIHSGLSSIFARLPAGDSALN